MCSVCVMNVVFAVKMYYLETTPPKWIQVFKILNNLSFVVASESVINPCIKNDSGSDQGGPSVG